MQSSSSAHQQPLMIRKAVSEDASGIVECLHSAFSAYEHLYTPAGFQDTVLDHESVHRRLREMTIFVALDNHRKIIGTIGCNRISDVEGHIRGMAVFPDWQGRGVAQRLLDAVEAELRGQRCSRISLDTTEPLERAMRFYERNGFRRSGHVGDFFGMRLIEYVKTFLSLLL